MKKHHLNLNLAVESSYKVIALYSDEQDYRMAFLLNKCLNTKFQKSFLVGNKNNEENFSVFEYKDKTHFRDWFLIINHCLIEKHQEQTDDLFGQNLIRFQQKKYYIKKHKKASFFLKIESDDSSLFFKQLINKIQDIPQIYATEFLSLEDQKNKKLLIL